VATSELSGHHVGFGAAAGEEDAVDVIGHLVRELLGIKSHLIMQINRRAVKKFVHLLVELRVDTWMAVSEAAGGDASEHVKISLTRMIVQVLHAALDDHDWLFVEGKGRRANILLPHLKNILI
jgi:hypothetical protein